MKRKKKGFLGFVCLHLFCLKWCFFSKMWSIFGVSWRIQIFYALQTASSSFCLTSIKLKAEASVRCGSEISWKRGTISQLILLVNAPRRKSRACELWESLNTENNSQHRALRLPRHTQCPKMTLRHFPTPFNICSYGHTRAEPFPNSPTSRKGSFTPPSCLTSSSSRGAPLFNR